MSVASQVTALAQRVANEFKAVRAEMAALPSGSSGPAWHVGAGAPSSGLGNNGDFYMRHDGQNNLLSASQSAMETGISDWAYNSVFGNFDAPNGLFQSSSEAHSGSYSLRIACNATAKGTWIGTNVTGLTVGKQYVSEAWVYNWSSGGVSRPAWDVLFQSIAAETVQRDAWVKLTVPFTAVATSQMIGLKTGPTLLGDQVWLDDVRLYEDSPYTGTVYEKVAGTWVERGSMRGSPGSQGVADAVPPGVIHSYPGAVAPNGWTILDGKALDRSQYSALFAIFGTTFGAGNGTTTFNLPDARGKVLVGVDTAEALFDALGKTGGEKAVTLSSAQIPAHTHPASSSGGSHAHTAVADGDGGHSHTTRTWGHGLGGGGGSAVTRHTASGATFTYDMPSTTDGAHSHPITVDTSASHSHTINVSNNTGGGGSHNNLQPYLVLNYIIKT